MNQQQFLLFSDLSNSVSQLLMAHFVATEIMMGPILGREWRGRIITTPMEGILQWLNGIYEEVPANLRRFLSWPAAVASLVKAEIRGEKPQRPWLKEFFRKETI
jgi:hypothetical protein